MQDKQCVILDHLLSHLGTPSHRNTSLDFVVLGYTSSDLSLLEEDFDEDEIEDTIFSMPIEKAPSPDGFIGLFFSICWDIIKGDIRATMD